VRIVLDTNTVLSGLLWRGTPHQLLKAISAKQITLFTSPILLAELEEVMTRNKLAAAVKASGLSADQLMQYYRRLARVIHPDPIPPTVLSDPDDDHVLACALTAEADVIVSGDSDLLNLKEHRSMRIMTAAQALKWVTRESN
jgi:putative PIN family toxin of toxin-antitoxin system